MKIQEKKELYDEIYFMESEYNQNEISSAEYCSLGITAGIDEGGNREKGYKLECYNETLYNKIEKLKKEFLEKTGEIYGDVFY